MKNYYIVFAMYRGMTIGAENEQEARTIAAEKFLEKDENISMVREVPEEVGFDYKKEKNNKKEIEVDYDVVK